MIRLVIYLLMALDVVLVVWGQVTYPPVIPTFPPPPTFSPVINGSLYVFVGKPVTVRQDERVTIDCGQLINKTIRNLTNEIIGNETINPVVTWCLDGREISNGSEINVIISADNRFCIITDTLIAVGGQLGTKGNYTCKVCNNNTCMIDTTVKEVCSPPNFIPPTDDLIVFPGFIALTCGQDATVESLTGVSLSLSCSILNGSDFTLELYKDGVLISNILSYDISPASDDDFGTYTFRILNKCGEDTAVTRILRQGDPPDIDEGPFIPVPDTVTPGDVTVKIGSPVYIISGYNVTIICNILTGTPPVSIIWLRNGMPEDPPRGNVTTITVTDATHGDVFTCRADNNIGYDNESTTIIFVLTVMFNQTTYSVDEDDGPAQPTLVLSNPLATAITVQVINVDGSATGEGVDYTSGPYNVTFPAGQTTATFDVPINDDNILEGNENFMITISPSSLPSGVFVGDPDKATVIIVDNDFGPTQLYNDTVVGDPLYEVPLNMISNETFPEVTSLCYEIHGKAGKIFSLISDGCVQVNANYSAMDIPENGNIISQIGVFAYDTADQCINILVDVNDCIPVVNGVAYSGDPGYNMSGVTARQRNNRVRITVPNCDGDLDDLVFWVVCQDIMGQRMIKFQVLRGSGLRPDSHGLIGQFWNIPVTASPIIPQPDNFTNAYSIIVDPPQSAERTFTAELYHSTWDKTLKPCLYAGDAQGAAIVEVNNDHSVIEGNYLDYEVSGIFGTSDRYNRLNLNRQCSDMAN